MKFCIVFAALIVAAVCDEAKFNKWQLKFNKNYSDDQVHMKKATFLKHENKIAAHNAKFEKGEVHHQLGHNQFSAWPKEKFQALLTMDKIEKVPSKRTLAPMTIPSGWVPGNLDLRTAAIPVQNQGGCGSCWAFSATGIITYNLYKRFGNYYDLAEQNFVDCARANGCSGGWMSEALAYYKANGVDYETSYPYQGQLGTCAYKNTAANDGTGIASVYAPNYYTIPQNELAMAYAVTTYGWISVCLNANAFQLYKSGIITAAQCSMGPNHAVIAVGYGHDTATGLDYWIIRNSWGSSWGEQGYARLERGKNACDIANSYDGYSAVVG